MDELNTYLYSALRKRAELTHLTSARAAIERLMRTPTPKAVIVTDAGVTEHEHRNVLERLVAYTKGGGIVVFACQFSSFVKFKDLSAMFKVMWKLPWTAGSYSATDFRPNRAAKGIDTTGFAPKFDAKALQLDGVAREDAIYHPSHIHSKAGDTMSTPAAYTTCGIGRVGFVGDVNSTEESISVILAMCFPKELPSFSSGVGPKPSVLILSLQKESWTDRNYAQLFNGLRKNATVTEVLSSSAAKRALASSSPSAVLVMDSAISKPAHKALLAQLVQYARTGGRVVIGAQFSNYLGLGDGRQFFSQWGLTSWDVGSYYRTTVALNPAGVPAPLDAKSLFPEYSMKALYIKGATPGDAVYLPTPSSHVESMVFANVRLTESEQEESPAVFTRVGDGYLGYVGDVNGEQPSIRLLIEMCGVKIKPGDLGSRTITTGVTLSRNGPVDAERETFHEVPLPTPKVQRPKEAEVTVRAARRAANSRGKATEAERLKIEGNHFFERGQYAEAAECYRNAALSYKPKPVFLTNLAAALLKLEHWGLAESAASRALHCEPTNIKARYRRGLALKEQGDYLRAINDFRCVLRLDPSNTTARQELEATLNLHVGPVPREDRGEDPAADESAKSDITTESDSEDYKHIGNGIPCRFYNHYGCKKGSRCPYRHAPDPKSFRDELGRNVCIYWLFDRCRYRDKCVYAHDKAYLPLSGRWKDEEFICKLQGIYDRFAMPGMNTLELLRPLWSNSWRDEPWARQSYSRKKTQMRERNFTMYDLGIAEPSASEIDGPGFEYGPFIPFDDSYGEGSSGSYDYEDGDEDEDYSMGDGDDDEYDAEMDERAGNYGFSHDELNELLSYGVKPWEDDAWDFLDAVHNL
ncbi:hypothetical protein OBBRIDRAFT_833801 [Obba rivulosa]|uniref:C3H1-type domain-containing protein n=1 Tax=Obba rivulosa TaxID=1052685 RepID=A0A8E2B429_9APHY|nr:hypothetical protein OBBRIDRAFT_833801 [Obba rivulosa]